MTEKSALGLIGGTFNPIHYGHLLAAEYSRYELGLDKVVFIPAARPPHKEGQEILEARIRYQMVEMAIQGNSGFAISDHELGRPGPSYTIDTIKYFEQVYPGKTIYFIMGADSLLLMDTWKDVKTLASSGNFIVVTRPGYNVDWNKAPLSELPRDLEKRLVFLEIPGMDISSSEIRKRLQKNKSIKYMLPDSVEGFIIERGLYR